MIDDGSVWVFGSQRGGLFVDIDGAWVTPR